MTKIKVSEIFGPAGFWTYQEDQAIFNERWGVTQGEGKFVGQRSVLLRTFGCNFECRGFGLPKGKKTDEPESIAKNINLYKSLADLPAAQYGCDSYYSWHPEFKHLSPSIDIDTLAEQLLQAAGGSFFTGSNPTHLILTGGEPMLGWQKAYPELIRLLQNKDPVWKSTPWRKISVTIETNGTKKLDDRMFEIKDMIDLTWSISPKLSVSGHTNDEAIIPSVVKHYKNLSDDMYLKFVVQSIEDFDEVDLVVAKYNSEQVVVPVYIMPEGGTYDEFQKHASLDLVAEAVKRGYNVTPRLHVMWGGNNVGW